MTARRGSKAKGPPIKNRWLEAVIAADLPDQSPSAMAVIAVAGVLFTYADADGWNCFPSVATIALRLRRPRPTIRAAIAWLVGAGFLTVTARANQHRPNIYRLTFPEGAEEHPLDESQGVGQQPPWNGSGGRPATPLDKPGVSPGVSPGGRLATPDPPPPNVSEEEEEGAGAPLPVGRGAAPLPDRALMDELFGNGQGPGEAKATTSGEILGACREIAVRAGTSIDSGRLAPALAEAKARTGWRADALAVYCIEKLKKNGRRVHSPTGFLVTDLARVNADMVPSPRMDLAVALAELRKLEEQIEAADLNLGQREPRTVVKVELVDSGVMEDAWDDMPDLWGARASHVEQYAQIVRGATDQARHLVADDLSFAAQGGNR